MTHWLFPANIKFYDVLGAFETTETYWPANTTVMVGDTVYLYLAAPYKQIGFICNVTGIDFDIDQVVSEIRPFFRQPLKQKGKPKTFMKLQPFATVPLTDDSPLNYEQLKQNGLTGMLMGPRKLENNPKLLAYIRGICDGLRCTE